MKPSYVHEDQIAWFKITNHHNKVKLLILIRACKSIEDIYAYFEKIQAVLETVSFQEPCGKDS
ncbi:MAG: hypothetical protein JRI28_06360 [Deltaproteobacteria bacterium]|nr:hypothetical protein [Deltaproteobacteria bacterium]